MFFSSWFSFFEGLVGFFLMLGRWERVCRVFFYVYVFFWVYFFYIVLMRFMFQGGKRRFLIFRLRWKVEIDSRVRFCCFLVQRIRYTQISFFIWGRVGFLVGIGVFFFQEMLLFQLVVVYGDKFFQWGIAFRVFFRFFILIYIQFRDMQIEFFFGLGVFLSRLGLDFFVVYFYLV